MEHKEIFTYYARHFPDEIGETNFSELVDQAYDALQAQQLSRKDLKGLLDFYSTDLPGSEQIRAEIVNLLDIMIDENRLLKNSKGLKYLKKIIADSFHGELPLQKEKITFSPKQLKKMAFLVVTEYFLRVGYK